MKKLRVIMLLMALTFVFTACGKKEEKDEVVVNSIETSTAPSYEEEVEEDVETEEEVETETEPEEIILEEGQFLVTGPDDEIGKPTMIWDEKDYVFNEELSLEIIDSLNEFARDRLSITKDFFIKEAGLTNMARIRATELYDTVYKSGETTIKQIKDLSLEERERHTYGTLYAENLDENEYTRTSQTKRLNGDENVLGSLSLEANNQNQRPTEKFGFYELGTSAEDILFAENGFRLLHKDGLEVGYEGYVSNIAHLIGGIERRGIGIACYENVEENTLVVSMVMAWPSE